MEEEKTDKAFKELANAIVLRAVRDYKEAVLYGDNQTAEQCERFFKSQWCKELTRVNCVGLARKLREKTEEFQYKADLIFKEKECHNDTTTTEKAFKCPICGGSVDINYIWISRRHKTRGYTAICNGCKLIYKHKLNGEPLITSRD